MDEMMVRCSIWFCVAFYGGFTNILAKDHVGAQAD